jgi:uncharacterized repeat protein (TIGR03843 family)
VSPLAGALAHGELTVLGRLPDASNLALLCEVDGEPGAQRQPLRCIYKPASGERPLWDFPDATLAAREVLSAAAAAALGWDLVPATVWRPDGPAGPGMCQEWVERGGPDPVGLFPAGGVPAGWCVVAEGRTADDEEVRLAHADTADLQRLAVLDHLLNNADRKGGHVLRRADGRLAAIDHGLTFHAQPKLRTVLWGWAGKPVPGWLRDEVAAGQAGLRAVLGDTPGGPGGPNGGGGVGGAGGPGAELSGDEVRAAEERLDRLLADPVFPVPGSGWPALPWPPM